ncbi:MAG: trehalose-phosphatase [Bacteroidota bacterium]|nr:trehalose-phosphatase [Bacteroidota bacterium]
MDGSAIDKQIEELTEHAIKAGSRLILLDFDGTLVDFTTDPVTTRPSKELLELLEKLASGPQNQLIIISGRKQDEIDRLVGHLPIDILAEHGAFIRENSHWKTLLNCSTDWKDEVQSVMEKYKEITSGSFIEEKIYSLAWHYRKSQPGTGEANAKAMIRELDKIVSEQHIKILRGKKVVEIIGENINKGVATQYLINRNKYDFILAIGDDITDEDMFRILINNSHAFTVKIGKGDTFARYRLNNNQQVMHLLKRLQIALN